MQSLEVMALERHTSSSTHTSAVDVPQALGNVLIATDWSPGARLALERAARLPLSIGGRVELTHVARELDADAKVDARLDDESERLRSALGSTTVLTSVLHGDTAARLIQRARHIRAELVVLGRHRTRTWRDMLLGTTVDRIVHDGSTSTLIVTSHVSGAYRRPLVAVDFSPSSRLALELAARVSRPENGQVCALHVASTNIAYEKPVILAMPDPDVRREMILAEARSQLDSFLGAIRSSVRWRSAVQVGDPGGWILEAARQRDSDLIVVGSAGKSLVERVLIGSVAQRVMRDAPCDVLVARVKEVRR